MKKPTEQEIAMARAGLTFGLICLNNGLELLVKSLDWIKQQSNIDRENILKPVKLRGYDSGYSRVD